MSKFLPRPMMTLTLLIIWLLVQMSVSLGNIVLGGFLAILIPIATSRFWPDSPRVKSFPKLAKYLLVFLYDVVVANLQVAVWIMMPQSRLRPRFLYVPIEVKHPFTVTMLASTISLTPGTVSSQLSPDRRLLIVHCLNTKDDDETIRTIKERYEKPLKEIFE